MPFRTAFLAVFLAVAVSAAPGAVESRQAADALSKKIAAITQRGNEAKDGGAPASVTLTQDELNSLERSGRNLGRIQRQYSQSAAAAWESYS